MRPAILLMAGGLLLTGCGTEVSADRAPDPDLLMTAGAVTVLDDGGGPELCLGGVAESLPPQCGGPALAGWDWSDHAGAFEEVRGTRWGDFHVVGRYDGTTFTVEQVTPAAAYDAGKEPRDDGLGTPCADADLVDTARTSRGDLDAAVAASNRLDGLAYRWLDTSRDQRTPEEMDAEAAAGNDDVSAWVLNVAVTTDVDAAEAALREHWGGGLCISTGEHTQAELRKIQRELVERPDHLSSGASSGVVELYVIHDDGSVQAELDAAYGEGVVEVSSALVPAQK